MKIVKTQDAPWTPGIEHGRFGGRRKALGGDKLSAGLWELLPGKASFPMHMHHVTEEAMYVVSGHAKVRTPEGETPIGPGDYVTFPPGGLAHHLVNDGTEPLIYIGLSASQGFDLVEYPESDKVAASAGSGDKRTRVVFRKKDQADYWEGEK